MDEMKTIMKRTAAAAALALGLASATLNGCGEAQELLDRAQMCQAQQDCVDDGFDVNACTDRCERRSDQDQNYLNSARLCDECIENRACAQQAAECSQYCSPIVH